MGAALFGLGKVAFAVIGVAVGVKLLSDARRHGGFGLHSVALLAIALGGLGLLGFPVAQALDSASVALAGELALRVAMFLLCVFVAGTFRPDATGAAVAITGGLLLVATLVWDLLAQPSLVEYDYALASSHANQLAFALPFAWSAFESGVQWQRLRRQNRLGLGDPIVAKRLLIWSVTTSCFVSICLLAIGTGEALAAGAAQVAEVTQGLRGILYFAIAALVWQGMFASATQPAAAPAAGS